MKQYMILVSLTAALASTGMAADKNSKVEAPSKMNAAPKPDLDKIGQNPNITVVATQNPNYRPEPQARTGDSPRVDPPRTENNGGTVEKPAPRQPDYRPEHETRTNDSPRTDTPRGGNNGGTVDKADRKQQSGGTKATAAK